MNEPCRWLLQAALHNDTKVEDCWILQLQYGDDGDKQDMSLRLQYGQLVKLAKRANELLDARERSIRRNRPGLAGFSQPALTSDQVPCPA